MQPDLRDAGYLFDMLRFSREASRIALDTGAQAESRDRGLERSLSLIGEAANHISRKFRTAHPEIAWSEIIALRNLLVHAYRRIDMQRLLDITETSLPPLIQQLVDLVPPIPES